MSVWLEAVHGAHPLFQSCQLIFGSHTANYQKFPEVTDEQIMIQAGYSVYTYSLPPSAGIKQELQTGNNLPPSSNITSYLSLGSSTYFLNCLTLLRVCSASSLDGSMIRALGAFDEALTWLTLAVPVWSRTEITYFMLNLHNVSTNNLNVTLAPPSSQSHTVNFLSFQYSFFSTEPEIK